MSRSSPSTQGENSIPAEGQQVQRQRDKKESGPFGESRNATQRCIATCGRAEEKGLANSFGATVCFEARERWDPGKEGPAWAPAWGCEWAQPMRGWVRPGLGEPSGK